MPTNSQKNTTTLLIGKGLTKGDAKQESTNTTIEISDEFVEKYGKAALAALKLNSEFNEVEQKQQNNTIHLKNTTQEIREIYNQLQDIPRQLYESVGQHNIPQFAAFEVDYLSSRPDRIAFMLEFRSEVKDKNFGSNVKNTIEFYEGLVKDYENLHQMECPTKYSIKSECQFIKDFLKWARLDLKSEDALQQQSSEYNKRNLEEKNPIASAPNKAVVFAIQSIAELKFPDLSNQEKADLEKQKTELLKSVYSYEPPSKGTFESPKNHGIKVEIGNRIKSIIIHSLDYIGKDREKFSFNNKFLREAMIHMTKLQDCVMGASNQLGQSDLYGYIKNLEKIIKNEFFNNDENKYNAIFDAVSKGIAAYKMEKTNEQVANIEFSNLRPNKPGGAAGPS